MHILLILALAVLFPATHILSGWLFEFATLNENISLIYMPAFLRLFNLLILGPLFGTLATILGGLLLTTQFNEPLGIELLNVACSSAGPLMALIGFKILASTLDKSELFGDQSTVSPPPLIQISILR